MALTKETQHLADDLIKFMQKKFGFDRIPQIKYVSDKVNSENILGMTGGYNPDHEEITIYITDRHPKDVLRSLAHEMMHHVQKCEGALDHHDMASTNDPNYIMHDEYLKEIEADAFRRGNVTFREWEASKKGGKQMSESKKVEEKMSKAKLVARHKKAKEAMPSFVKQYGKKKGEKIAYATAMSGKMDEEDAVEEVSYEKSGLEHPEKADLDKDKDISGYEMKRGKAIEKSMHENKEVKINDALINSHAYVPSDRALADAYNMRDEKIYNELLRKFKIKK